MTTRLEELENDAIQELKEWAIDNYPDDPSDVINEIADSYVPVYNHDILRLAVDNINLALDEPELGPAFDGSSTPINIIAANIYEYIEQALYDAWNNIEEEINDNYGEDEDE